MKLNKNDVVLFSGDSITHGNRGQKMDCNHIMGHGYQYTVAGKLAAENADTCPKFINKGYSGFTMEMLLGQWQEDVLCNHPTVLSVLAGANDCHQGFFKGYSVEETAKRYRNALCEAIDLTRAQNEELKLIIGEPFYFPVEQTGSYEKTPHPYCEEPFKRPDCDDTPEMRQYRVEAMGLTRTAAKQTAEKYGAVFVPFSAALEKAMENSAPEYFIWDGTHPTVAGHWVLAMEWLNAVK